MGYSSNDLSTEIKQLVEAAIGQTKAMPADWIKMSVIARHPLPGNWTGDHRDFAVLCIHSHVRSEVKDALRKMKVREDLGDPQITMEGFNRLQRAYIIERNNELVVVPLELCTTAELLAKAEELQAKIEGMAEHRAEILRYLSLQRAAA